MRRLSLFFAAALIGLIIAGILLARRSPARSVPLPTAQAEASLSPAPAGPPSGREDAATTRDAAESVPQSTGLAGFDAWLEKYLGASPQGREVLLAEGRRRAQGRRGVMARMIREDPRAALAAAVPMVMRQELPPEIVGLLEERVSGRGTLALIGVVPPRGQAGLPPTYRSAMVSGQEYRAYVFGRRELPGTVERTSMHGIAIDGHMAIAESPLRVLEAGERPAGRPLSEVCGVSGVANPVAPEAPLNLTAATAVEYDGTIHVLCQAAHRAEIERQLLQAEETPMTAAAGGPGSSNVFGRPSREWTHGPKATLVMRVDFSDRPGPPRDNAGAVFDETSVANVMRVVEGFFRQNSFGKTSPVLRPTAQGDSPDVTPVLRMPQPATYYNNPSTPRPGELMNHALDAARTAGFEVDEYHWVGLLQPYLSNHLFSGQAQVGGRLAWYNGEFHFAIVAHELGHNYGVVHSNAWVVPDRNPISAAGFSQEYRDWSDVMGGGNTIGDHFSQWHKSVLQWIQDEAVLTPTVSGIYRIYSFDDTSAVDFTRARAIKVPRDAERDYWIGHRVASRLPAFREGASLVWGYQSVRSGDLLDMTPATADDFDDAALPIGVAFTDPVAGVTIKPVARGGTVGETWLDVSVAFDGEIKWARREWGAAEADRHVTLRLTRSRDVSQPASVRWSTADATALAGADYQASGGVVSWTAGDVNDKFITIALFNDNQAEPLEWFWVRLSDAAGAQLTPFPDVQVFIGEAGTKDRSFQAAFPSYAARALLPLADQTILVGGGFSTQPWQALPYHRSGLVKLSRDGEVVTSFAEGPGIDGLLWDIAQQADGRILVAGQFGAVHGVTRRNVARLLPDGSLDASFAAEANGTVWRVLPLADGRILIAGIFTTINGASRPFVARLRADGSVDPAFTPPALPADTRLYVLAVQADGRVLIGGGLTHAGGGTERFGLLRLHEDGSLDGSFGATGAYNHPVGGDASRGDVRAILVQPDGRIVIGGVFSHFNGSARPGLVRLMPDGSIDPSFQADVAGYVLSAAELPGGRLVVGGFFNAINGTPVENLAFLSATDGLEVAAAGNGGFQGEVLEVAVTEAGRVGFVGDGTFQDNSQFGAVWQAFAGLTDPPSLVNFPSSMATGTEGGTVSIVVDRGAQGFAGAVSVSYATSPGTASDADFVPTRGVLTWGSGDSSDRTIQLSLRADAVNDGPESFYLNLGAPLAGSFRLGAVQRALVTINPGPAHPPPDGDWTAGDIGAVGVAGGMAEEGEQVTVRGSGADIWGAADGFHFHAARLDGDGTIVARVASLSNTHAWAKAGLMFREDAGAGSRNVFAYVTAGNHAGLQHRAAPGGGTAVATDVLATMPQWLKLVRTGNTFAAFRSANGADWIALGAATVPLPTVAHVGLAVTSHNNSLLATAVFEHVDIVAAMPPATAPAAPSGLHATAVTSLSATLAWTDHAGNETGFAIERASGGGASFAPIATVGANVTTFEDAGLTASTTYTYRVRAVAGSLFSSYAGPYTLTTMSGPSAAWVGSDIGNVGLAGTHTISGSQFEVNAAGADIWGAADGFRFVHRQWRGDGEIVARITGLDNTHAWAKAGVMFRESLAPGARNVMALLTAANSAGMQARTATGGATTLTAGPRLAVPQWVRLVRQGDTFTASTSPDGVTWTVRGTQMLALPLEIFLGVATSSHVVSARTTAVYEQVTVPDTSPPPPEWTQANWGAGAGSFTEDGTGLLVSARGADIWGAADDGVFVHRPIANDGAITLRLDTLGSSHPWAKAGVMWRASPAANAANVFLAVTPGAGLTFQIRAAPGSGTVEMRRAWGVTVPVWLRLTRQGDQFTAEYATDGNSWQSLGVQTLTLPIAAAAGVAVSSHAAEQTAIAVSNLTVP